MSATRDANLAKASLDLTLRPLIVQAAEALAQGDEFFRRIVDLLPAAVYTTDAGGRITYFNEAAVRLWGHRPVLGESLWCGSWKLFWPDGREMPHDQCPMAMALKEGRAVHGMEAIAERPDGVRVPFVPYPTPIRDSSGRIIGAVNMLMDVSERKRSEVGLQRLAAIVESSDDAIVSKDLDGIITSWNTGAERIYGYLADEVVGQSIMMLIPPDRRKEEETILERIRRGQRASTITKPSGSISTDA
jgi:PAS domain S-box-containing protein